MAARGKTLALTRNRRSLDDFLASSRSIALVAVEKVMHIPDLAPARLAAVPKPSWYPLFLKAYALASRTVPELRQAYLSFPYARIYEHPTSTAWIAVERIVDGKPMIMGSRIKNLEGRSLREIDERLKRDKTEPLETLKRFRREDRIMKYPWIIRKLIWWAGLCISGRAREQHVGTFCSSSLATTGVMPLHVQCPLTSLLTFGPVEPNGNVLVRLFFDHRVFDGMAAANALNAMERAMNTEILTELRGMVESDFRSAA